MNCKQGDLVVIVNDGGNPMAATFIGAIRRVTEIAEPSLQQWAYKGQRLVSCDGGEALYIPDSAARPIRGGESEDEILRMVGKPEGVAA